ncbi:universal stress protein [Palleronia pelagia]|uniref:Nucleotide-binding universal stress protein, UspA family n=1 Tax=Palleronia pelagia TaxID=387096 RepID=A0A1H8JLA8_9RHOB|nr:universal stress protein [Palleronia pelagia]SEN81449.1 Nucleotide-binding universal stress protein, UspA family [Palleronia pelagia]
MSQTILLPVDLSSSPSWEHALPKALEMAKGGTLHVVTVIPNFGSSMVGGYFSDNFMEQALHEIGEDLTKWVNANIPSEQDVNPHVVHGRIYEEIIKAAENLDVDTIVMGTPPHHMTEYLLGPNAARVVRHSKKSVYVVRG